MCYIGAGGCITMGDHVFAFALLYIYTHLYIGPSDRSIVHHHRSGLDSMIFFPQNGSPSLTHETTPNLGRDGEEGNRAQSPGIWARGCRPSRQPDGSKGWVGFVRTDHLLITRDWSQGRTLISVFCCYVCGVCLAVTFRFITRPPAVRLIHLIGIPKP